MIPTPSSLRERKNIVVLGAGFGGLRAARRLVRLLKTTPGFSPNHASLYRVVLIDRNNYQIYTPTLYDVAVSNEADARVMDLKKITTLSLQEALAGEPITFLQDEIKTINVSANLLQLRDHDPLPFAYLIVALGSEISYFGIPGLEEYALPLKTFTDAIRIRDRLNHLFLQPLPARWVAIGGAGPTGVELAGELAHATKEHPEWKKLAGHTTRIFLIEGKSSILGGFDPRVITKATARLKALGVELLTSKMIARVEYEKVTFRDGSTLPYDLLIWTGGVRPAKVVEALQLRSERSGQLSVNQNLLCTATSPLLSFSKNIYSIGDASCFIDPKTGKPLAGVARVALTQADIAAFNIVEDTKKGPVQRAYQPHEWPYIVPVGGKWVIAKIGPLVMSGFIGWIFKMLVELNYFVSVLPLPFALRTWLKSVWIFWRKD